MKFGSPGIATRRVPVGVDGGAASALTGTAAVVVCVDATVCKAAAWAGTAASREVAALPPNPSRASETNLRRVTTGVASGRAGRSSARLHDAFPPRGQLKREHPVWCAAPDDASRSFQFDGFAARSTLLGLLGHDGRRARVNWLNDFQFGPMARVVFGAGRAQEGRAACPRARRHRRPGDDRPDAAPARPDRDDRNVAARRPACASKCSTASPPSQPWPRSRPPSTCSASARAT